MINARSAFKTQTFLASDLGYRACWRQIAVQNNQMRILLDWVVERADDLLPGRIVGHIGEVLGQGFSGDCQCVAMQKTRIQHALHQWLNAANGNQIGHHVLTTGSQIRQYRRGLANLDKIIQCQLYIDRVSHRQQMQHAIGGSRQGNNDANGIFKSLAGHDIARFYILCEQLQHLLSCAETVRRLIAGNRVLRGRTRQ